MLRKIVGSQQNSDFCVKIFIVGTTLDLGSEVWPNFIEGKSNSKKGTLKKFAGPQQFAVTDVQFRFQNWKWNGISRIFGDKIR